MNFQIDIMRNCVLKQTHKYFILLIILSLVLNLKHYIYFVRARAEVSIAGR